jgi:hypothetical protein
MYKIKIKNGQYEITEESKALRPITAYREGMIEPNIVYAIATKEDSMVRKNAAKIKLFDMSERTKNIRELWLEVILADRFDYVRKFSYDNLVSTETNLGSFRNLTGQRDKYSSTGQKIMNRIWSKTIPDLFNILKLVDEKYGNKKTIPHTGWVHEIGKESAREFKSCLAEQLGVKNHWEDQSNDS